MEFFDAYRYTTNPVIFVDENGETEKYALNLISKYRSTINEVAQKYELDPMAIAVVLHKENRLSLPIQTLREGLGRASYDAKKNQTASVGIAQMQILLVKKYTGITDDDAAIWYALSKANAIDLIGQHLVAKQGELGAKVNDPVDLANLYGRSTETFKNGKRDQWAQDSRKSLDKIQNALNGDGNEK